MRVVEAFAAGVVATIVVVLIAHRVGVGDLLIPGAVAFLVAFMAVLLRSANAFTFPDRK